MGLEVVLTCEHAGNEVPSSFAHLFRKKPGILDTHRGYDIGAYELTNTFASVLKKEPHVHTTTRLLVDLNRSLDNPTAFSEYVQELNDEKKEELVYRYYLPHREKVEKIIRELAEKQETVLHLSVHTFTPQMSGTIRNADIGLLYDPGRANEKKFCREWREQIQSLNPELVVRMNYPYKGTMDGFTTYLRGEIPEKYYWGIELEVNQKYVREKPGQISWDKIREVTVHSFRKTFGAFAGD